MNCVGELRAYASVNVDSKISQLQLLAVTSRTGTFFSFDSIWYYINNNPYATYHKYKRLFCLQSS